MPLYLNILRTCKCFKLSFHGRDWTLSFYKCNRMDTRSNTTFFHRHLIENNELVPTKKRHHHRDKRSSGTRIQKTPDSFLICLSIMYLDAQV